MEPLVVLAIQCTCSGVIFFLLAKWYFEPKMIGLYAFRVLEFLLLINVFRYLPLSLYMPGQVANEFPDEVKDIVAHGDFISALLAFIALVLLRTSNRLAIPAVWLFSMVSIGDMILALSFAMKSKVYELTLGVNYFTVAVYVPMLMVIQYQVIRILTLKKISR